MDQVQTREGKLHVLVNNSGTNWSESIETYPIGAFDKVMKVNVNGLFHLTQQCVPLLEAAATPQDPSTVINIASINALGVPVQETYAYSASKAAVAHLTRHLAGFLGQRSITCNAICPGPFPSRMMAATLDKFEEAIVAGVPLGRVGGPLDMAGTAIYLASRAGAYTNGAQIVLDGGAMAAPKL